MNEEKKQKNIPFECGNGQVVLKMDVEFLEAKANSGLILSKELEKQYDAGSARQRGEDFANGKMQFPACIARIAAISDNQIPLDKEGNPQYKIGDVVLFPPGNGYEMRTDIAHSMGHKTEYFVLTHSSTLMGKYLPWQKFKV